MSLPVLGIDIAKKKFQIALLRDGKVRQKSCSNDRQGFVELSNWLTRQKVDRVHACLEATGSYGQALAEYLADAGHTVSMVNPARIQGFARSELLRTKTDQVDAELIARFCLALKPEAWDPEPLAVRELRSLVRRLGELRDMEQMEANRLEAGSTEAVLVSLRAHMVLLEGEIEAIMAQINNHIDNHPDLKKQRDLLISIPGIGEKTAALLLGEVGTLFQKRSAREVTAYAGLDPRERTSGTSVRGKPRLSKVGNKRLRKALYMPAVVAMNYNPLIRAHCDRMLERGKAKMAAVGAAMRKLLVLAHGVLKSGKPFDPKHLACA